ncbi:MAG: transglutaminase domain-containing protein [Verrucomicrobia bacterium]|nr:transglutaminase domain-containing protein [Verrucomicrobiota bacterium]
MKTPPFLMGAALLFWGWQTGLMVFGAIAAIFLESSRFVAWRWEFSNTGLNRVWDLCVFLFLGVTIYCYFSDQARSALFVLLEWSPMIFLPFMAAQAYGAQEKAGLHTFFWLLRKGKSRREDSDASSINVSHLYFGACILAASAGNVRHFSFYMGLCLLCGWASWFMRPGRASRILWGGLLAVACAAGYVGHVRLHQLHNFLEGRFSEWFSEFDRGPSLYESATAIGRIGDLKLSGRIVFRVVPEDSQRPPPLLRETAYNAFKQTFGDSKWYARGIRFESYQVRADAGRTVWKLLPEKQGDRWVTIFTRLKGNMNILALPRGSARIENLPALAVERNRLGAVGVVEAPGFVRFRVNYGEGASIDGPPDDDDLQIPEKEDPAIAQIAAELKLKSLRPREALKKVASFFEQRFTYSTYQAGDRSASWKKDTPIAAFLLRTRSGHCEYFATATVLLLRKAGIPARYATGYSVQELDRDGRMYVVRKRHAHAWTLAYVDDAWRDFDTTPPSWSAVEEKNASLWEPVYNVFSWLRHRFSSWFWLSNDAERRRPLVWLLIPLMVILAWRLFGRKQWARLKKTKAVAIAMPPQGSDSEFYLIERRMADQGLPRHSWETHTNWLRRLAMTRPDAISMALLHPILALHDRHRFDPQGLASRDRQALRDGAHQWLTRYGRELADRRASAGLRHDSTSHAG